METEAKKQRVLFCDVYVVEGLLLEEEVEVEVKTESVFVAARRRGEEIVSRKEHFPSVCKETVNEKCYVSAFCLTHRVYVYR